MQCERVYRGLIRIKTIVWLLPLSFLNAAKEKVIWSRRKGPLNGEIDLIDLDLLDWVPKDTWWTLIFE